MYRDFLKLTPPRYEYVAGDWGYVAEINDVPAQYSTRYDHSGTFHHVAMTNGGYRTVRHFAESLDRSICGLWTVPDQSQHRREIYFRAYETVADSSPGLYNGFHMERKLTRAEFEMLVFLDFPDEITESKLDHLIWTANEHDIELVPEKRDYLLIAARLSQD